MHENKQSKTARHHSYHGSNHGTGATKSGNQNSVNSSNNNAKTRPTTLFKSKSSGQFSVKTRSFGADSFISDETNFHRNNLENNASESEDSASIYTDTKMGSYLNSVGSTDEMEGINEVEHCDDQRLHNNQIFATQGSYENNEGNGTMDSPGSPAVFYLERQNNQYNNLISIPHHMESDRQSLKHLSASAPAMRTDLGKGESGEFFMAPSSSKSRQKKFHRHFTKVPIDEKVLDYYSCALVGDILLQGFLYISENYFAFYSNVFGYVTKLLIPITTVVKITKERTAKIFPNAVGIVTQSERHVFASLISRDTTFKLMSKVWLHHSKQSVDTLIIPKDSSQGFDDTSGDIVIADDSSGDSSGNDSALDPSSCSASPQNTPGLGLQNLLHVKLPNTTNNNNNVIAHNITQLTPAQREDVNLKLLGNGPIPSGGLRPHLLSGANLDNSSSSNVKKIEIQQTFRKKSEPEKPLLILATVLLVILFISAAFLLIRISYLQEKLSDRPSGSSSEQFYQDLLSWQNRLHSNSAEEIHQFIDTNLQQIVRVRESLEALSTLFMNGGPHNSAMGDHVSTHSHFSNRER